MSQDKRFNLKEQIKIYIANTTHCEKKANSILLKILKSVKDGLFKAIKNLLVFLSVSFVESFNSTFRV